MQYQLSGYRLKMKRESISHIPQPSRSNSGFTQETSENRKKKQAVNEAIDYSNKEEILNGK